MTSHALPGWDGEYLPVGRFRCDIAEARTRFVADPRFAGSATRQKVWSDWETLTIHLRSQMHVCAAWLGGSFTTAKEDPSDVDVVYVVEDSVIESARANAGLDPRASRMLDLIIANQFRTQGYGVDSYLLPWRVNPEREPRDALDRAYLQRRGYWDDFWLRVLSGPKTAPRVRADAVPRRGYVEVILDGYQP